MVKMEKEKNVVLGKMFVLKENVICQILNVNGKVVL